MLRLRIPFPAAELMPIATGPESRTTSAIAKVTCHFPTKLYRFSCSGFSVILLILKAKCIERFDQQNGRFTSAVNMERRIPSASVCANPFHTSGDPLHSIQNAAISVVIYCRPGSRAESAFLKPLWIAPCTEIPAAISSRIRA